MSETKPPSMIDVAQRAGVSAQTVSRVLRDHPYVAPEKRERVLQAVAELGYRMNAAAKALSSGRTRTIGVITMATESYAGAMTQASIERAAELHGYVVTGGQIATLDVAAIVATLHRLEDNGAEAFILALPLRSSDPKIEEIAARLPTATVGGAPVRAARALSVDQQEVARTATRHLLTLGHDTVWHVAGPSEWVDATERERGWREILETTGRTVPPVIRGDWSPESGYQAGLKLAEEPGVTAIFCASDEMAFGVISALRDRGLDVPGDVSVASVDDVRLAAFARPALTTVAQPFDVLSQAAVDSVIARLEGTTDPTADLNLQPTLVVRGSTGPRPER